MPKQNPKYMENLDGEQVRNVVLVQVGGWSGLPTSTNHDPDYPLEGGKTAYLSKSPSSFSRQMELIRGLGKSVAVAFLLMNDADSMASGYGACWQGSWVSNQSCSGGSWRKPLELYREAKAAANARGIAVAPEFSIMNYQYGLGNGAPYFLPRLKDFLAWARPTFDSGSLRNANGQYVVVIDGLYEWTPLNDSQRVEIMNYMASQPDILWVDNMVGTLTTGQRSTSAANIFSTSWGDDAVKNQLRQIWGESYLYTFTTLGGAAPTHAAAHSAANQVPQSIREKWMNIEPYTPTQYPVFIHQWNEYAEYLIFEPSQRAGNTNYEYLKWMISRQQPLAQVMPITAPVTSPVTAPTTSPITSPITSPTTSPVTEPVVATTFHETFSVAVSALTSQHPSCTYETLGKTVCLAAANRYCVARQFAGGFAVATLGAANVVCLKAPDSRGLATTFTALKVLHDSCASSVDSDSPACLAASHRFCMNNGFRGGIGIMEYDGNNAVALCSMKLKPTLVGLAELTPLCTTASARSRECTTASEKVCKLRGFKSGYGMIEYSSTEAVVNCVE